MKKISAIALTVGVCLVTSVPVPESVLTNKAFAEESAQTEEKSSPRVRRTQTLRPIIFEKLEDAREALDAGDSAKALEVLAKLEKRKRNSYERAMTHNMYAIVYSTGEQYKEATEQYEKLLEIKNVPETLQQTTRYTLAQLYMIQEKYDDSLASINSWMEQSNKVTPDSYFLRSQIQYQRGEYQQTVNDVQKSLAIKLESGSTPLERWYLLERAALYQLKDYQGLAKNLESLVAYYSKADYWVQLAAVYNEIGMPEKELSTLETAYDQGLLTKEREYVNFAQALLGAEIPYKAGQVLEKAMNEGKVEENASNLSLLGDSWMLAKEYDNALVALTKAADASGKGSDYFKLAQIYTQRQEWLKANEFADKSLANGDLKAPYQALIVKGLAQFNLDRLDQASATFFKAGRYPEAEKMAMQWQTYIENEQQRREYIAEAMGG